MLASTHFLLQHNVEGRKSWSDDVSYDKWSDVWNWISTDDIWIWTDDFPNCRYPEGSFELSIQDRVNLSWFVSNFINQSRRYCLALMLPTRSYRILQIEFAGDEISGTCGTLRLTLHFDLIFWTMASIDGIQDCQDHYCEVIGSVRIGSRGYELCALYPEQYVCA